jgi:hypothetical protein
MLSAYPSVYKLSIPLFSEGEAETEFYQVQ